MKFTMSASEQYITLENTAEHMLARFVVRIVRGDHSYLTKQLSKLVCASINADQQAIQTDFCGDDQVAIIEGLHSLAISEEDSWRSAQAAHMLETVL
jgi:hypothetical protein